MRLAALTAAGLVLAGCAAPSGSPTPPAPEPTAQAEPSCGDLLRAEAENVGTWVARPTGGPIVFMEDDGLFLVSSVVRDLSTGESLFPLEHSATDEERLDIVTYVRFDPRTCRYLRRGRDLGGPSVVQIVRAPEIVVERSVNERDGATLALEGEGSRVMTAWRDTAAVLDAESGERIWTFDFGQRVIAHDLAPDGSLALIGGRESVALKDLATGREIARHVSSSGDVRWALFGPDGSEALIGTEGAALVWDLETGEELHALDVPGAEERVRVAALSPPPARRAFVAVGSRGALWDLATGEILWRIELPERIDHAAFSPTGDRLILADELNRPVLLVVASGEVVWEQTEGARVIRP